MENGTAKIKTLAYANLDIAPDDPEAFDIESVALCDMTVSGVYPPVHCFLIKRRCSEYDPMNYCVTYHTSAEACEMFKRILKDHNVTKVAVCEDIEDYIYDDEEAHYTRSSTNGDYSPSNPWDAPGMCVSDFIKGVC